MKEASEAYVQKIVDYLKESVLLDPSQDIPLDRSLLEAGVLDSYGIVDLLTFIEGEFDRQSGYQKALLLLQSRRHPTAIFAANDLIALGVLSAVRQLELRCPQDSRRNRA